jgi:ribose/xylose/arabinose/galactoside ABC-type transport system permease subunit
MAVASSVSRPAIQQGGKTSNQSTIFILISGVIGFLVAEQVATGWLALGERINISRRDFNLLEIILIIAGILWALFSIWTVGGLARRTANGVRAYLDDNAPMSAGLRYAVVTLAAVSILCLFIAIQIITGWLALGERINISRRDLNWIEIATIVLCILTAGLCLRTVLGFWRRERPAWSWGQWALFLGVMAGLVLLASSLFDVQTSLRGSNLTIFSNLAQNLLYIAPGLVTMFTCLAAYNYVAADYSEVGVQKDIVGGLSERAKARDVSAARVPAAQSIRNNLAKSPGAGAIIGFIAIFALFSVATDLFLQPISLASALSNNVTRGIIAIGTTILMISGEFDLSVGSLLGIGGLAFLGLITAQLTLDLLLVMLSFPVFCWVLGSFIDRRTVRGLIGAVVWIVFVIAVGTAFQWRLPQLDPILAGIIAVTVCCGFGYVNGFLLIRTGIPSFIVTLATQLMLRAIPLVLIAGGKTLRYVDYFSDPPNVEISRILISIAAIAFTIAMVFIGRSVLTGIYQRWRQRWEQYATDASDFRTLALAASTIYLVITAAIFLLILYLVVGGVIDQLSQFSQGSPYLTISFFDLLNGRIASLPFIGEIPREINLRIGVFWWLVLVVIFQFILNQTRYGNATFAVGGNPGAARAQGINVNRVRTLNYILLAMLVGVAALLDASRLQSIDALRGTGLELEVIAATVIGGALLSGGYGSIIGALLGVFIFGMVQTGLVLIGIDARLFDGVIGGIILIAVVINNWSRRIRQ